MTRQRRVLATLTLLGLSGCAAKTLHVDDAWIAMPPPTATTAAGYLTLINAGSSPVRLTAVQTRSFNSAGIHRTVTENGMARMQPAAPLTIAAGETVEFRPGGLHIMLMGPLKPLTEEVSIDLELLFEQHDPLPVVAQVRRWSP